METNSTKGNEMTKYDLMDYATGDYIREATETERQASDDEVAAGHPEGLIVVDGRTCYVEEV